MSYGMRSFDYDSLDSTVVGRTDVFALYWMQAADVVSPDGMMKTSDFYMG